MKNFEDAFKKLKVDYDLLQTEKHICMKAKEESTALLQQRDSDFIKFQTTL
jgi:hypothetical protein